MTCWVRVLVAAVVLLLGARCPAAGAEEPLELERPVPGPVLRDFHAPAHRYAPGHRGVDLAASTGQPVVAAADGVIAFAGRVAGRASVSVLHAAGLRTTYTPVTGVARPGDLVRAGEVLGHVDHGSHCASGCLHWGLTDGEDYFDPLGLVTRRPVALLPVGSVPAPPAAAPAGATSEASWPVAGRVSSAFGMRRHPVTGLRSLHDGLDIAAPCGAPVSSLWAGSVVRSDFHRVYGFRVVMAHPGGHTTTYAHLRAPGRAAGSLLPAGSVVGAVGSTGLSTGCHLHLMVTAGGGVADPLAYLPDR